MSFIDCNNKTEMTYKRNGSGVRPQRPPLWAPQNHFSGPYPTFLFVHVGFAYMSHFQATFADLPLLLPLPARHLVSVSSGAHVRLHEVSAWIHRRAESHLIGAGSVPAARPRGP